jgi:hypothetical protein
LLDLSEVCNIAVNKRISALSLFLGFQEIHSGCCTVAAQVLEIPSWMSSRPCSVV